MKKVVISGSASLNGAMKRWVKRWEDQGFEVLNWPVPVGKKDFLKEWPRVHKSFYRSLEKTDIHFIANEDKGKQKAYVGNGTFAEIAFRAGLNLTQKKKARIILAKKPDKSGKFFEDLSRWLELGWIEIHP